MESETAARKFQVFWVIWITQVISRIGSQLSGFALGVWVYQRTGSVTEFAFILLSASLPGVILAPLLGTLADRWDRRITIMVSDFGAAIPTLILAILLMGNRLEVWHIYIATAITSALGVVQWSAFMATLPLLVPKEDLGRANGLVQIGGGITGILGPALAGVLVVTIQLPSVIFIDVATFILAVAVMSFIRIPKPLASVDSNPDAGVAHNMAYAWNYLVQRPGLLGFLIFFGITNLLAGIASVLITPIVLSMSTPNILGFIVAAGGVGMLVGGIVMGTWGGPRQRALGVLIFVAIEGLFFIISGIQPSALLFGIGLFGYNLAVMLDDGCYMTILHTKVAQDVQGRIFGFNHMITKGMMPVAYLITGFLADKIFEPLLAENGALAGTVGQFIGTGPGRGLGLLYIILGVLTSLTALVGFLYPRMRFIETELPDAPSTSDEAPANSAIPVGSLAE